MPAPRIFLQRLQQQLDSIGLPSGESERIAAFSKLFNYSRSMSASILSGRQMPNTEVLETLAQEFEVTPEWLCGHED